MDFKNKKNTLSPKTSLKHFSASLYHKFCNVIIRDVWEQIALKIPNKERNAMKFSCDDIGMFKRSLKPAEEMMNAWKMDNPSIGDLLLILKEENILRGVTFIEENLFQDSHENLERKKFNDKNENSKKPNLNDTSIPFKVLSLWTNNFNSNIISNGGNFINSGGFADVYLGSVNENKYAIKKFKNKDCQSQFENEAVLFSCDHPNLIKLFYKSDDGPSLCLVYEFVAGGSLLDYLYIPEMINNVDRQTRVKIALQTASGLQYLHQRNIVHRDIKSANILLTSSMDAKIGDFGISKLVEISNKDSTHVLTSTLVGTLVYMAPEYLYAHEVSSKIDMYSFGVVLLELLFGEPAYYENREKTNIVEMFEDNVPVDKCWALNNDDDESNENILISMNNYLVKLIDKKKHLRPTAEECYKLLCALHAKLMK